MSVVLQRALGLLHGNHAAAFLAGGVAYMSYIVFSERERLQERMSCRQLRRFRGLVGDALTSSPRSKQRITAIGAVFGILAILALTVRMTATPSENACVSEQGVVAVGSHVSASEGWTKTAATPHLSHPKWPRFTKFRNHSVPTPDESGDEGNHSVPISNETSSVPSPTKVAAGGSHEPRYEQLSADEKRAWCRAHLAKTTESVDTNLHFRIGLCWSDVGLAKDASSTEMEWLRDEQGYFAPAPLVRAEAFLMSSELAAANAPSPDTNGKGGPGYSVCAAARAARLYRHAKHMALRHHDAAAIWRYKAASEVAVTHGRQRLAGHALARLSYFLLLRGRPEEALEQATGALSHDNKEPLARFLSVTLQRSLGRLETTAAALGAEQELGEIAGQLPSNDLEEQRTNAYAELRAFRAAEVAGKSAAGLLECFALKDAAHLLLCLLGRLFLKSDPEASSPLGAEEQLDADADSQVSN